MSTIHKIRLPSVNDIFPPVTPMVWVYPQVLQYTYLPFHGNTHQPQQPHQYQPHPQPQTYTQQYQTHSIPTESTRYRVEKPRQNSAWSDEDDSLLRFLKEERNLGWREISLHFKNRTANGCQFRWRRLAALEKEKEKLAAPVSSLQKLLN